MIRTYEDALNALAEQTFDNQRDIKQKNKQRRTGMEDLFDSQYYFEIVNGEPFDIYIAVSNDLEFYERFQFKIRTMPLTPGGTYTLDNVRIKMAGQKTDGTPITIDLTPYFMAHHDGEWIDEVGIFPTDEITSDSSPIDFYDILRVCSNIETEGQEGITSDSLLIPGYKKITIEGTGSGRGYLINYLKYSHINR